MPIRGSGRRPPLSSWKPTAQSTSAGRVGADHHHLVADRLHHARLVGQRLLDRLDEALDHVERLLLARLLGQPRVAREVGEGDRHAQAAELVARAVELEVPDHVLADEVLQHALVHAVHDRRGQREQVRGHALHLLGDLEPRHAVAHQRLVHVEVEELDLGVGDLRQRLPVHAHELQEGDEREARVEHRGHVAQELEVLLADLLERLGREARRRPDPLDQRRLEPGVLGRLRERARARG